MGMNELPSGTVTLLFTDIEGSTRLLHDLGAGYRKALEEHRRVIRNAVEAHGGVEVDIQGDAFFVAFPHAGDAVHAAQKAQQALEAGSVRVRMGIHTGEPERTETGYVGVDVHRAARIASAGHGGQVLLSQTTRDLLGEQLPVRDLGAHRLKDLLAPERIYQVSEGDFPPLKTLHQTNLPVTATPFLGRVREVLDVTNLLAEPEVRLLTLTGPGGTGKTRLALQAAAESGDAYRDGVFWVPLAPVRYPSLVLSTVSQTLSAKDELATSLRDTELLLLLDNFEHVVEAAPQLSTLLAECPSVSLLVTSRERLQLAAEYEYQVPPLAPAEGVELFTQRARAVGGTALANGAVAELCNRLDNLPLALELAAARTKLFSPAQLLDRLGHRFDLLKGGRDADPRQQTLRATIEWSYDLLDPDERKLLARFSIFAGGCDLAAAEAVCDADPVVLASLIDKSLIRRRETAYAPRFWMLETIREYAAERLRDSREAEELRTRHAEYFLALAEAAFDEYGDPEDPVWFRRFDDEQDNFRVAMTALVDRGGDGALRLAQRLWTSWFNRGQLDEGERWVKLALDVGEDAPLPLQAWMLGVLGEFPRFRGDHARAIPIKEQALALARSLGTDRVTKALICDLSSSFAILGDIERARTLVTEALEIERQSNDPREVRALGAAAELAEHSGDHEEARHLSEQIVERLRQVGETGSQYVVALSSLADSLRRLGDDAGAAPLFVEALRAAEQAQVFTWVPETLDAVAAIIATRAPRRAAALMGAADAARRETGLVVYDVPEYESIMGAVRGEVEAEQFDAAWNEGSRKSIAEAIVDAIDALSAHGTFVESQGSAP
jgi:predicted ATPase/class 3 adenylate cyclase